MEQSFPPWTVRSLFFSDLHLGSRFSKARALASVIRNISAQNIIIVGDFWDEWLWNRRRYWCDAYSNVLDALAIASQSGTQITFVPGNHDLHCAEWFSPWFPVDVCLAHFHRCPDGRTLYVVHGDRFDVSQNCSSPIARRLSYLHEHFLGLGDFGNNFLRALGVTHPRIATALTAPWKGTCHAWSRFDVKAIDAGKANACDGIVCGHTHTPKLTAGNDFLLANCGDWLENCSILVEPMIGGLELWQASPEGWLARSATLVRRVISTTVFNQPYRSRGMVEFHEV